MSKIKLSNEDKLLILITKGHYKEYENPLQFIVAEIYDLELKYVDEHKIKNHLMKLYSKLWEYGYITLGENPVLALLQKVNELGRAPLAPVDLYWMMYGAIQNVLVKGLELDDTDDSIISRCKLKEES